SLLQLCQWEHYSSKHNIFHRSIRLYCEILRHFRSSYCPLPCRRNENIPLYNSKDWYSEYWKLLSFLFLVGFVEQCYPLYRVSSSLVGEDPLLPHPSLHQEQRSALLPWVFCWYLLKQAQTDLSLLLTIPRSPASLAS